MASACGLNHANAAFNGTVCGGAWFNMRNTIPFHCTDSFIEIPISRGITTSNLPFHPVNPKQTLGL